MAKMTKNCSSQVREEKQLANEMGRRYKNALERSKPPPSATLAAAGSAAQARLSKVI
jgi:hypothetical protein